MQLVRALVNFLLNTSMHAVTGGVLPDRADAVTLTGGQSWAYGSWAQIAATVGSAKVWLDTVYVSAYHVSGGEDFQGELGTGAAASETAITGSIFLVGEMQSSNVGEVPSQVWRFPGLIAVSSGTRLAGRVANKAAAANTLGVKVHYLTGVGN